MNECSVEGNKDSKISNLQHFRNIQLFEVDLQTVFPSTISGSLLSESQIWLLPLWDYIFIQQCKAISVTELGTWQGKWICGIVLFGSRCRVQFVSDGPAQSITLWRVLGKTVRSWYYIYSNKGSIKERVLLLHYLL